MSISAYKLKKGVCGERCADADDACKSCTCNLQMPMMVQYLFCSLIILSANSTNRQGNLAWLVGMGPSCLGFYVTSLFCVILMLILK